MRADWRVVLLQFGWSRSSNGDDKSSRVFLFVRRGPHTRPHHTTADSLGAQAQAQAQTVEISLAFGEARPGELLEAAAVARDCGQQQRRRRREGAHGVYEGRGH
ncbi:hypothetical protein THAR02_08669 [Trichoderma harzianum]|uniref:Uncharacterized protein n=1 Tax=Trichoderma harzianum TaxID=5544 RepID=A0A0F9X1Y5_TRIHA|nr:hypothetical protein THAR02_08669 [Trichoderma harzianum]